MKPKGFFPQLTAGLILLALAGLLAGASAVTAQEGGSQVPEAPEALLGTVFTFQGRLNENNAPANGVYDFRFRLFNASTGGSQVGPTPSKEDVLVTGGAFVVTLDFGAVFTGNAYWLQMEVRPGSSTSSYTVLSPRERLNPTPYALGLPGLWTQQNSTSPNVIGGTTANVVTSGVVGAVISGGGYGAAPNRVWDNYGVVGGGIMNQAGRDDSDVEFSAYATVGGGFNNVASRSADVVGGGLNNTASGSVSVVAGGNENTATAFRSTVGGGFANDATGFAGTVGGGSGNEARGDTSVVAGGGANLASGANAAITGGQLNTAGGDRATIGGGNNNAAGGTNATIGGGTSNQATAAHTTVGGGESNLAERTHATVGGGLRNVATGAEYAAVAGGAENRASGYGAFVGGGFGNQALADYATIAGGTRTNWFDPNTGNRVTSTAGTVGGGGGNRVTSEGGTIAGGWANAVSSWRGTIGGGDNNVASGLQASTVAGGWQNQATGLRGATIGGGESNLASGQYTTVGGGLNNDATGGAATVSGGQANVASGNGATISGGELNTAAGSYATVLGGQNNAASGDYSLAGGQRAKATATGCFVWGDAAPRDVSCPTSNTFVVRATNGVYLYTNQDLTSGVRLAPGGSSWLMVSDRALKEHFAEVDGEALLARLTAVPIQTWSYKSQDASIRHIGPLAQDFQAAFAVGEDSRYINALDADGVALAAAQALVRRTDAQQAQLDALAAQNAALAQRVVALEQGQGVAPGSLAVLAAVLLAGLAAGWLLRQIMG